MIFKLHFLCHLKSAFTEFNPVSPILGCISSKIPHCSASPGQVHTHPATFPAPNSTAEIQFGLQDTKLGKSGIPAARVAL